MARGSRMLPGIFTKEEQDAAFALQDAGIAHPTIDDQTWAHIERHWTTLPRSWGRGPFFDRTEHAAVARTTGPCRATLYRVTTERWGLELWGTPTGSGIHRGTLDELLRHVVSSWPPPPPDAEPARAPVESPPDVAPAAEAPEAPEAPERPRHREAPVAASQWLEAPSPGPVVIPGLDRFQGSCSIDWETAGDVTEWTPAQARAARTLVSRAGAIRDDLLHALFRDQRESREDEDFPPARSPRALLDLVALRSIWISRDERGGLAYAELSFDDAWRIEHGLCALLHGERVVAVGGYGDVQGASARDRGRPPARGGAKRRDASGALLASRWQKMPHDATVAFPMWEGLGGKWRVRLVAEVADEPEITSEQQRAADLLVEEGDAIREALLARLLRSSKRSPGSSPSIRTRRDVAHVVEARRLRIHAEACDGVAYTEMIVHAPWRRHATARVVMNGKRVVALTIKAKVADVIEEDQEERLRAKRALKSRRKRPAPTRASARR